MKILPRLPITDPEKLIAIIRKTVADEDENRKITTIRNRSLGALTGVINGLVGTNEWRHRILNVLFGKTSMSMLSQDELAALWRWIMPHRGAVCPEWCPGQFNKAGKSVHHAHPSAREEAQALMSYWVKTQHNYGGDVLVAEAVDLGGEISLVDEPTRKAAAGSLRKSAEQEIIELGYPRVGV